MEEIKELLNQVTEGQKQLFMRIYHHGVPESEIETAKALLLRTIKRNEERMEIKRERFERNKKQSSHIA